MNDDEVRREVIDLLIASGVDPDKTIADASKMMEWRNSKERASGVVKEVEVEGEENGEQ